MKIIKILTISIALATISANALALEGVGVTLLREKIESSPGVNGRFIQTSGLGKMGSATTSARAYNANGKVKQDITISGSHSFNVVNQTRDNQFYNYKFELSAADGRFFRKTDSIMVKPGGNASDSASSYFSTMHDAPGKWTINAVTNVSGESSQNSSDHATLTVNK